MSAPAWLAAPCGCGCRPEGLEPGCPCPECQPGDGIDHEASQGIRERLTRTRMKELLLKEPLSPEEAEELDGLLHWHIHR